MRAPGDAPPPNDPWAPGVRASDVPIVGEGKPPFDTDDFETTNTKEFGNSASEPQAHTDDVEAANAEVGNPDPQEDLAEEFENSATPLHPNKADIQRHLFELFSPKFVNAYPDAWIEIAYGSPASGKLDKAERFSVFDIPAAVEFA